MEIDPAEEPLPDDEEELRARIEVLEQEIIALKATAALDAVSNAQEPVAAPESVPPVEPVEEPPSESEPSIEPTPNEPEAPAPVIEPPPDEEPRPAHPWFRQLNDF